MGDIFSTPAETDTSGSDGETEGAETPAEPGADAGGAVDEETINLCIDACMRHAPAGTQNLVRIGDALWTSWISETTHCPCAARVLDLTETTMRELQQGIEADDDRDSIAWSAFENRADRLDGVHNPVNFTRSARQALGAGKPTVHIGQTGVLTAAVAQEL